MPVFFATEHEKTFPPSLSSLRRTAERLLDLKKVGDCELSVALVSDDRMRELNREYRKRDAPTNVLAFPLRDDSDPESKLLGDVVISLDTAWSEALRMGVSFRQRVTVLLIHGFLHLLGYDHERSDEDFAEMRQEEKKLSDALCSHGGEGRKMTTLAINVDHVATVRQARGINEPDPVFAAAMCELAGAMGIVVHLREDRRHIQDRDVRLLRETVKTKLNLEMGATEEIIRIAIEVRPDLVTLVPEKRAELTTEGGLNVAGQKKKLKTVVDRMSDAGIPVSMFIDPDSRQIEASLEVGAAFVEIHTGRYCDAVDREERLREYELVAAAAEEAHAAGLLVNAGHGLNYRNVMPVAALPSIEELSIGHAIIARSVFVGLDQAVREMAALILNASRAGFRQEFPEL